MVQPKMPRLDGESIYRRIAVRMHADEKVQRLTKPPPYGRSLWWELLAGEQTDVVPGLFRIGEIEEIDLAGQIT